MEEGEISVAQLQIWPVFKTNGLHMTKVVCLDPDARQKKQRRVGACIIFYCYYLIALKHKWR